MSCHVSIKSPLFSRRLVDLSLFQHEAGRCRLGLLSHPRHLTDRQRLQTHSLGSYHLITANWLGFRHLESPWTRTIRSGHEGPPGSGGCLSLLQFCSAKWWIHSKHWPQMHRKQIPGTQRCQWHTHRGPACQPCHPVAISSLTVGRGKGVRSQQPVSGFMFKHDL